MRTDTGICATSGSSGRSWCFTSQRRTAPAQIETITSLTVVPRAFFTALISSSGSCPNAKRRWADMRPLNCVFGACSVFRPRFTPVMRPAIRPTVPAPGMPPKIAGTSSTFGIVAGKERSRRSG